MLAVQSDISGHKKSFWVDSTQRGGDLILFCLSGEGYLFVVKILFIVLTILHVGAVWSINRKHNFWSGVFYLCKSID
jgi:hypothetical protein